MNFFILSVFLPFLVGAQTPFPKDTSYTISNTYQKEIKKFPFISIAKTLHNENIKSEKQIVYQQTATRNLHLDTYLFQSKKKLPAVILLHGGGWKSGDKSQMETLATAIAAKEYNCFAIEYRLSPEAKYPAGFNDVKEAIAFIIKNASRFNSDPNKIAILGCSSGGQMAALLGTTSPNEIQAIVDLDGILAFHHPESEEGKIAAEWLGGTYEENPKNWMAASALTHTNKNTPPILFVNSQWNRFHAGRDDMIHILNQYKIYSEIKTFENSPHSFWFFNPWFEKTVTFTTQFLDKILKKNK